MLNDEQKGFDFDEFNEFGESAEPEEETSQQNNLFSIVNPDSSFEFVRNTKRGGSDNFSKIQLFYDENRHLKNMACVNENMLLRISQLKESFPNFEEVISFIEKHLTLKMIGNGAIQIDPIYLWGEPGLGKTEFVNALDDVLGVGLEKCNAAQLTGTLALSGTEPQWSDSSPGLIVQSMMRAENANFIFFIDELEKANSNGSGGHPLNAMYELLEEKSARRFVDQAITSAVLFDASAINFIGAGNDTKGIHPALLSRFNVFEIPKPTANQLRSIVLKIHQSLLSHNDWGSYFSPDITLEVIDEIINAEESVRHVKKSLKNAYVNAYKNGRNAIDVSDVEVTNFKQNRIGFY